MNFSKDFSGIGSSYGNWQKYAGLGDKFLEEITSFPQATAPVAPPAIQLPTDTEMKSVDYGIAPTQMPIGFGVSPTNTFGTPPTMNQGFSSSTKAPTIFDLVDQHYGVNNGR